MLEVIIWVTILMLVAGISTTWMLKSWWKWSFEHQASILLKDIDMARELALYKREGIRICFYGSHNFYRVMIDQDAPANSYYIERKLNRRTGFASYYGLSSFYYYDEQGIIRNGSINFGSASNESYGELRFTYEGTPASGGHVALYSAALDKVLVVIVKPVTGRARIGKVRAFYSK